MSQTRLDLPPSPAQILEAREQPFLPKAGYSTPCRCLRPRGLRDDHMAPNILLHGESMRLSSELQVCICPHC